MLSTPTRDLPEEFLAATRKSQEAMIRAIRTWVETVKTVTPKLPSAYAPLADRLPKLPSVTVPFADRLPKPEDVVASGYDFAEHLLANQRKFAEDLLAVTEPLIPANGKRTWNDATRKDAAAAAEKTVAAAKTAVTETAQAAQRAVAQAAPKPAAQPASKTAPCPVRSCPASAADISWLPSGAALSGLTTPNGVSAPGNVSTCPTTAPPAPPHLQAARPLRRSALLRFGPDTAREAK